MLLTSLSARSQAMMTIGMVVVARLTASIDCGPTEAAALQRVLNEAEATAKKLEEEKGSEK
jgi:hypothetical protein